MNQGLFEPLVMFSSLTNSPATFQTMMNDIFKDLIDEGYMAVYMDDILVYTHMIKHHREVMTRVLDMLRKHQLYLKVEKCTSECTMVEYLGLVLSEGWVEMDPIKIAGVRDWLTLRNVTEVQSFMGFVNFYHRFIPEFSPVAGPLHCLTKKAEPWQWTKPKEAAFQALKSLVMSAPILILPDQDACFRLETDTSGYATRAILSQLHNDEKWHPVSFTSKSLSPAEHNYTIYDKELLSVICGLEEWRHILEGTKHMIRGSHALTTTSDHENVLLLCFLLPILTPTHLLPPNALQGVPPATKTSCVWLHSMFRPPQSKSLPEPSSRVMQQTTQLSLDAM